MNTYKFPRLILISLLGLSLTAGCYKTTQSYNDPATVILSNSTLSQPLKDILAITHIEHDGTLDSVVQATQKEWLRKPGVERWQIEAKFNDLQEQLAPLFHTIGMVDEVRPSKKTYEDVVILGATVSTMRERFAYALKLWNEGIRFKNLIFLVGQRPRDTEKESVEVLYNRINAHLPVRADWQESATIPVTETEMAQMIYDQAQLPEQFKQSVNVHFIDTPMQPTADGTMRRPNTGDTIKLWLKELPVQGSVLAISNQPYIGYQHAVLKTLVPVGMAIETAGAQSATVSNVDVLLDNLARWLYQLKTLNKNK